ncbi:hypothetical protein RP20_CCG012239 [Aedes albopictus]|nr:hypothetical protein RP20_CCG012239 [Aedes albopictus]
MGKRAISRAESWALRLQAFDFKVKRIPGDLNVADALSRLIAKTQIDEPFDDLDEKHLLFALDAGTMNVTWQEIDLASESDPELVAVCCALKGGAWPENLRRYEAHSKELRSVGSRVFKDDRIVLPEVLRNDVLKMAHQGHIGGAAMKRIMREYFWWPGMSSEVETFVKNCNTCLRISKRNPPVPLTCRQLPNGPWEILQIDFLSLPNCGSGEFLIVVDTYSRYITAIEMKCKDAKSTNTALNKVFHQWGLPLVLQSDNGPPFQSNEFLECWQNKGVDVRKSIPHSPQSNGSVERQNQGIIKALAGAKEEGLNWKGALETYVHVHNTLKPHSRLGVTPFELMVGWKYRGNFPSLWESDKLEAVDRDEIEDKDAESKLSSKRYADNHRGAKPSNIRAGDKVVVVIPKQHKTDPTFSNERFTVLTRQGAKVVIRSERGVEYTRNIQDVKRAPEFEMGNESRTSDNFHMDDNSNHGIAGFGNLNDNDGRYLNSVIFLITL